MEKISLQLLSKEEQDRIHAASLAILEQVGMAVMDPEALDLLAGAGAQVDCSAQRVRFPASLIQYALDKAPAEVKLYGRDSNQAVHLRQGNVYYSTSGYAVWVYDPQTGQRRKMRKEDLAWVTRLADGLDHVDIYALSAARRTPTGRAWRVPAAVRWPGHIAPGSVTNEIVHHMDWLPTFVAAAGEPDIKGKLKAGGVKAIGRSYKVHLDGYDLLPLLTGQAKQGPRKEIFYFSDDGDLTALRYQDWKVIFMEQRATGTLRVWAEPFTPLRVPLIFNLRRDPYERAQTTSNTYYDWLIDRVYLLVPAQAYVAEFLKTFKEFPPRQQAASFSLDRVMESLSAGSGS